MFCFWDTAVIFSNPGSARYMPKEPARNLISTPCTTIPAACAEQRVHPENRGWEAVCMRIPAIFPADRMPRKLTNKFSNPPTFIYLCPAPDRPRPQVTGTCASCPSQYAHNKRSILLLWIISPADACGRRPRRHSYRRMRRRDPWPPHRVFSSRRPRPMPCRRDRRRRGRRTRQHHGDS